MKKKYKAHLTYKMNDEVESKLLSARIVKLVLEVEMTPEEFGKLIREKELKVFSITIH